LLFGPAPPDVLVFVHGYDIPLAQDTRMATWERAFRDVAATMSATPIVLRSNLRIHRSYRVDWERSHGGALAAAGHLLTGIVGRLYISSSFPRSYPYRWGSHWQLDPLWSSDRLEVVHHGERFSRIDKVRRLVGNELAERHLRVCWENRTGSGNCSTCDKCVSTMALLLAAGADTAPCFDWTVNLADRIDAVPWTLFVLTYQELIATEAFTPRVAEAVRGLLARSAARTRRQDRRFRRTPAWRRHR
jgi:hypothetical protein